MSEQNSQVYPMINSTKANLEQALLALWDLGYATGRYYEANKPISMEELRVQLPKVFEERRLLMETITKAVLEEHQ